ncbi:MAG TPA: alpha/beta fold hydrolase [Anaerolineae bacterium]|nr:alpha/beta fold hydrolase [Anaerolineae bacterium]
MYPLTEVLQSETGLLYRMRRGQPRAGLIVLLHGLTGDENVMWIFDHALPREATVIAPRALYASELGGYSWARSVVRDDLDDVDFREALDRLAQFMNEVIALVAVDPQHVIVMGFSQGAALSYTYSLLQPDLLRGVIALAGFLPQYATHPERSRIAAQSKDALPHYLIIHGTHDEAVPIERAREARSVLESRGAIVEYHEHRVGHKVSAQGMKEIARWIKATL